MSQDTATAEQLVDYLEGQRKLISEAQASYRAANSRGDKAAALTTFATKKAALEASLPPRDSKWCLASISPGTILTATIQVATIAAG